MRRVALGPALAACLLAVPFASPAEEEPVMATGGGPGAGWVGLKIETSGAGVHLDLKAFEIATPNFIEIYTYDASDRFLGGFGVGSIRREGGVFVEVNPSGEPLIHYDDTFAAGYDVMEWSTAVGTLDGVMKLLIWSSGPQAAWSWALRGGADVSVLATTGGTGSYAFMSHDMNGVADVRAHDPVYGYYGGRASVERSKTIDVQNTLIGFYVGGNSIPPVTNNVLTISGPVGDQLCYPGCNFERYENGWPPGTYRFGLRAGSGFVWSGNDDILAVAVDARLPE